MPTLQLHTNVTVAPERRAELLARLSAAVAELLGKPESYVMVLLDDGCALSFGGSTEPTALLELLSLGLPESETPRHARALCALCETLLGVPERRVYIDFRSPPRHLFGWNGGTFQDPRRD
ncbi:phenylpyruvate tautomerase MIF-related protein [Marichromatium gracile]|uniref:L-dopachrome isomerase n=1 Tax=Marichromatium gracile TaxID=1048 RepID=A0A4R4AFZ5_MARGR|nr:MULTISPECIES: phenylpyruvate tautomerase MIF-related protein [Marichromatium]MBO8086797.1 tautomerase family protein [Marichromatium sp.]MBK1710591.1 hypothetical protein [Marichromatium gracile]MCF1182779.1 phenylpyruvate tautomerase MIF-related protein [Marichromatium gracile]RNE89111.1 hypothetical protein EBL84_12675 [Marichromatium sp. AB31]RNE91398.1 hypothetical protein EBL85_13650 [Marichromatium sp. AB32]